MATRLASWLIVVSKAVTSNSPEIRSLCRVQALSLPLLQESQILGRVIQSPIQRGAYQFSAAAWRFYCRPNERGDILLLGRESLALRWLITFAAIRACRKQNRPLTVHDSP